METPWDDCKVAFWIDDDEKLMYASDNGKLKLPSGWTLDEIDGSGARLVAVFRVDGFPLLTNGQLVEKELRKIKARRARKAAL